MALVETEYTSTDTHSDYSIEDKVSVFGGEEDLWGSAGITREDLNSPEFAVKFDLVDIPQGVLIEVDGVEIEVFYRLNQADPTEIDAPPFIPAPWAASAIGPQPGNQGFRIVVVGLSGRISYSDDEGVSWAEVSSGVADTLRDICYVNGKFIAVGDNGRILTSANGVGWAPVNLGVNKHIYAVGKDRSRKSATLSGSSGLIQSVRPDVNEEDVWTPGFIGVR